MEWLPGLMPPARAPGFPWRTVAAIKAGDVPGLRAALAEERPGPGTVVQSTFDGASGDTVYETLAHLAVNDRRIGDVWLLMLRELVEAGAVNPHAGPDASAVHALTHSDGALDAAEALGFSVDASDARGFRALHGAISGFAANEVARCLRHGADANAVAACCDGGVWGVGPPLRVFLVGLSLHPWVLWASVMFARARRIARLLLEEGGADASVVDHALLDAVVAAMARTVPQLRADAQAGAGRTVALLLRTLRRVARAAAFARRRHALAAARP